MNMSSENSQLGEDPQSSLEEILAESCRMLFSAYGIDITSGSAPDSPQPLLGRIHFVGRDMSGNLTIGLDREQLNRAWQHIDKLPTERRQALVLRFVEEMSTREISQVLGRSEGATRVLIHRALTTVARQIERGSDAPRD